MTNHAMLAVQRGKPTVWMQDKEGNLYRFPHYTGFKESDFHSWGDDKVPHWRKKGLREVGYWGGNRQDKWHRVPRAVEKARRHCRTRRARTRTYTIRGQRVVILFYPVELLERKFSKGGVRVPICEVCGAFVGPYATHEEGWPEYSYGCHSGAGCSFNPKATITPEAIPEGMRWRCPGDIPGELWNRACLAEGRGPEKAKRHAHIMLNDRGLHGHDLLLVDERHVKAHPELMADITEAL